MRISAFDWNKAVLFRSICVTLISQCVLAAAMVCVSTRRGSCACIDSATVVPSRVQMSIFTIHTNRIPQWGLEVELTFKKVILYGISFMRDRIRWKEGGKYGRLWNQMENVCQAKLKLSWIYVLFFAWSVVQKHSWLKLLYQHICCNPLCFWIWLVASPAQFLCLACLNILPSFSSASSRQIKLGGFDWGIMLDCWVENDGSFSKVYHSGSNSGFSQRVSETWGWGVSGELAGLFYSCFSPTLLKSIWFSLTSPCISSITVKLAYHSSSPSKWALTLLTYYSKSS